MAPTNSQRRHLIPGHLHPFPPALRTSPKIYQQALPVPILSLGWQIPILSVSSIPRISLLHLPLACPNRSTIRVPCSPHGGRDTTRLLQMVRLASGRCNSQHKLNPSTHTPTLHLERACARRRLMHLPQNTNSRPDILQEVEMESPTMFLCRQTPPFCDGLLKLTLLVSSAAHPAGSSIMLLGGFGFLSRLHGLSIDNLVEVEMVLADGRIVIVNQNNYPGSQTSWPPDIIFTTKIQPWSPFRSLVGRPRRRSVLRNSDSVQGESLSGPRCVCRQSHIVCQAFL